MLELKDEVLQNTLPSSIADDKTVQDICKAIKKRMAELDKQIGFLLLLPRLDELAENLVDELAYQYHVDFYDYTADIEKKRALVRKAIAWHRYKGTPAAVEEVCTAAFQTAKVYEWWQYDGKPYHFQVRMVQEAIPNESVIESLYRAIMETKNTRSWLDEMSFYREAVGTFYEVICADIHRVVSIYPSTFKMPDTVSALHSAICVRQERRIEIKCQTGAV